MKHYLGMDIGGTEVKGGVVDENGSVTFRYKCPTNSKNGIEGIKAAIKEVLGVLKAETNLTKIGIASAGNINCITGKVAYATNNLSDYTGFDLKGFVKSVSGLDAVCDNDAYCALLGEFCFGAAKGYDNAVMITLGTGVGGAVMLDGKLMRGKNFDGARLGHLTFVPFGKQCTCGNLGCAEAYLSGTAFTNEFLKSGIDVSHGSQIFDLAKGNDALSSIAKDYINKYFSSLALFVDNLYRMYVPDVIVIGGGMSYSYSDWPTFFFEKLEKNNCEIKCARLKNDAGLVGAAIPLSNFL